MTSATGRTRRHRRALPLASAAAGLVGASLFVAACGGSTSPGVAAVATTATASASSAEPSPGKAALAFSRCMRSHGVSDFPDPNPQGDFPSFHTDVPKPTSTAAKEACKHLLSRGGGSATPQQRRQKFAFALKVAACLRRHGFPDFPDPTPSGQHVPPKIDTNSPQFSAAETACEQRARKALGLP